MLNITLTKHCSARRCQHRLGLLSKQPKQMQGGTRPASAQPLTDEEQEGWAAVKERVKQQFEQRAAVYDADPAYHPSLAAKLLELCPLQPGQTVLDLACGTGHLALPAATAVGPTGRVVGVDLSPAMLQQATDKAATQGVSSTTMFVCGDIESLQDSLPVDMQGAFDAAACSAAVVFLTQPQATFASWRQWLKPGGRLALNAFPPPALRGYELLAQMLEEQSGLLEQDPCAALGSVKLITAALQGAGYRDIQVVSEVKQRWVPAESAEAYADRLWQIALNNNPFRTLEEFQARLGEQEMPQFHGRFVSALASSVTKSGEYDPVKQGVLTAPTILHAVATA